MGALLPWVRASSVFQHLRGPLVQGIDSNSRSASLTIAVSSQGLHIEKLYASI